MARFNPDTYPDRQSFDAHARALRREEFDRLAALALRRARRFVARDSTSNASDTSSAAAQHGVI
jgi:hypothetical protein